jgi:hypothetical protein
MQINVRGTLDLPCIKIDSAPPKCYWNSDEAALGTIRDYMQEKGGAKHSPEPRQRNRSNSVFRDFS